MQEKWDGVVVCLLVGLLRVARLCSTSASRSTAPLLCILTPQTQPLAHHSITPVEVVALGVCLLVLWQLGPGCLLCSAHFPELVQHTFVQGLHAVAHCAGLGPTLLGSLALGACRSQVVVAVFVHDRAGHGGRIAVLAKHGASAWLAPPPLRAARRKTSRGCGREIPPTPIQYSRC